jgi:cell division cycle 20-like protein 1 (cofactor of APC complex)
VSSQKHRKIPKLPAKVLDAPALQDDFYLNLIDWSEQNLLAVGLSSSVYLWSAITSKVTKLCDMGVNDSVTAVNWTLRGPMLGVGTNSGEVQIWDTVKMKKFRTMQGHTSRIGAIAWNSNMFSSGSRDKTILHRDLRVSNAFVSKLVGHKQ